MIRFRVSFITVIVVLVLIVTLLLPTTFDGSYANAEPAEKVAITIDERIEYDKAWKTLELINKARVAAGKTALVMDKSLVNAALTRASEIAILFDHKRPDGSDWSTVPDLHKAAWLAENLAVGQATPEAVVNGSLGWVNSQKHYATLIDAKYKSTGIVCVTIGGNLWWVQVFSSKDATPLSKPANSNKVASVNALTSNLNAHVVISPKVPTTETPIKFSIVNRNNEFDVPLHHEQFDFSWTGNSALLDAAGGVIRTGAPAGSYEITAARSGSKYTIQSGVFKIQTPAYVPPDTKFEVSYLYDDENLPYDAPLVPSVASFYAGSKVYIQPPVKLAGSTFSGWSGKGKVSENPVEVNANGSFNMPEEDVVFTGSFDTSVYDVNFYDVDGALLATEKVSHGTNVDTLPFFLSTDGKPEGPAIEYDSLSELRADHLGGRPCKSFEGEEYIFDSWQPDAETCHNFGVSQRDSKDNFISTFFSVKGDLNLHSKWAKSDDLSDYIPGMDENRIFKISYYASTSDLPIYGGGGEWAPSSEDPVSIPPIAVKTVNMSDQNFLDTQILPTSEYKESMKTYFKKEYGVNIDGNSSYDLPMEWHNVDFGYANLVDGESMIAPVTPRAIYGYLPFKRGEYLDEKPFGPELPQTQVDGVTTIRDFLELQEDYETWYRDEYGDDVNNKLVQLYDKRQKNSGDDYTAINIFLRTAAPKASFEANVPAEIQSEFSKDSKEKYIIPGLPDPITLVVDEEILWGVDAGTQTVNLRLPEDVPSLGTSHAQDYIFKGWSSVPTPTSDDEIAKPGEMLQFDISHNMLTDYGERPIYAQWAKRSFRVYYYLQESDSDYFAVRDGLDWTSKAFPDDGSAASVFDFLGKKLSDYVFTGTPESWSKVILGTGDVEYEVDDYTINSGSYPKTPSAVSDFFRTQKYDYARIILDWKAVKPAGMDLTVASTYAEDKKSGDGKKDPIDDEKDDDENKNGNEQGVNNGENNLADTANGASEPTASYRIGGNAMTPLTGNANTAQAQKRSTGLTSENEPKEPLAPSDNEGTSGSAGLTPLQLAIIIGVILIGVIAGLIIASKFGLFSAKHSTLHSR
ncbi:MAG: CAP domain-containing protein [Clostridiales Family XIII bacterium]|jgi:uncharacterized protein YkwD|nr:CAP domain-containing protein [Clostridiales Family XIII bacterium]